MVVPMRFKALLGGISLFCFLYLFSNVSFHNSFEIFLIWVQSLGFFWGPIIFSIIYVLVTVLFLPSVILSIAAGFIYGTFLGTVIVQLGGTIGACLSFVLGKMLFRDCVLKMMESYPMFSAIDKAISLNTWKIVTLLRLSPITPFNVLNYGLSLTRIKFWDYTWSSTVGMLPQSILFVYMGTAAKNISDILNSTERNPMDELLFYLGICFTVITIVVITVISTKAIKQELHTAEEKKVGPKLSNIIQV